MLNIFFHLLLVSRGTRNVIYAREYFRVHIMEASDRSFAEDDLSCMCHLVVSKMNPFI